METQVDYSTLNRKVLARLPLYTKPPTYRIDKEEDMGSACYGDPPGYPTYFLRNIWTRHGNYPGNSAQQVIAYPGLGYRVVKHANDWKGVKDWEEYSHKFHKLLQSLWLPLPIDHPRVRAWMMDTYNHQQHCYYDLEHIVDPKDDMVIWPVPYWRLKSFHDDPRFSEEWRRTEREQVERANREYIELCRQVVRPETFRAVVIIQRYYPAHIPVLEWIKTPPGNQGNWWTIMSEPPSPEECPGQYRTKHPINGSWCQWCGWRKETGYVKPTE